ncbi:MAG: hypothetical protein P1V97_11540 [Planctomycetota bacterium]|nr:hypothetical protein [Planctomycetota bacterium]
MANLPESLPGYSEITWTDQNTGELGPCGELGQAKSTQSNSQVTIRYLDDSLEEYQAANWQHFRKASRDIKLIPLNDRMKERHKVTELGGQFYQSWSDADFPSAHSEPSRSQDVLKLARFLKEHADFLRNQAVLLTPKLVFITSGGIELADFRFRFKNGVSLAAASQRGGGSRLKAFLPPECQREGSLDATQVPGEATWVYALGRFLLDTILGQDATRDELLSNKALKRLEKQRVYNLLESSLSPKRSERPSLADFISRLAALPSELFQPISSISSAAGAPTGKGFYAAAFVALLLLLCAAEMARYTREHFGPTPIRHVEGLKLFTKQPYEKVQEKALAKLTNIENIKEEAWTDAQKAERQILRDLLGKDVVAKLEKDLEAKRAIIQDKSQTIINQGADLKDKARKIDQLTKSNTTLNQYKSTATVKIARYEKDLKKFTGDNTKLKNELIRIEKLRKREREQFYKDQKALKDKYQQQIDAIAERAFESKKEQEIFRERLLRRKKNLENHDKDLAAYFQANAASVTNPELKEYLDKRPEIVKTEGERLGQLFADNRLNWVSSQKDEAGEREEIVAALRVALENSVKDMALIREISSKTLPGVSVEDYQRKTITGIQSDIKEFEASRARDIFIDVDKKLTLFDKKLSPEKLTFAILLRGEPRWIAELYQGILYNQKIFKGANQPPQFELKSAAGLLPSELSKSTETKETNASISNGQKFIDLFKSKITKENKDLGNELIKEIDQWKQSLVAKKANPDKKTAPPFYIVVGLVVNKGSLNFTELHKYIVNRDQPRSAHIMLGSGYHVDYFVVDPDLAGSTWGLTVSKLYNVDRIVMPSMASKTEGKYFFGVPKDRKKPTSAEMLPGRGDRASLKAGDNFLAMAPKTFRDFHNFYDVDLEVTVSKAKLYFRVLPTQFNALLNLNPKTRFAFIKLIDLGAEKPLGVKFEDLNDEAKCEQFLESMELLEIDADLKAKKGIEVKNFKSSKLWEFLTRAREKYKDQYTKAYTDYLDEWQKHYLTNMGRSIDASRIESFKSEILK